MDELKHRNPVDYIRVGTFLYPEAYKKAILRFKECPKIMTFLRHADASEDSPLHCVCVGDFGQIDLLAPRQLAVSLSTHEGNQFLAIRVTTDSDPTIPLFGKDDSEYWLVSSYPGRRGVLLSPFVFEQCGGFSSLHALKIKNLTKEK